MGRLSSFKSRPKFALKPSAWSNSFNWPNCWRQRHDNACYMPEEMFDVVNERDEVVGRQSRSEVHRLGLKHRAVHVLVFNSRGQVFLQKRSLKKDCFPGVWDSSASGHLNCGEDYDACAVRELREEIGLQVPAQRLFKMDACAETG